MAESEAIFNGDLEDLEPVATQEELVEYEERVQADVEEEQMLRERYVGETELRSWCTCSMCSLEAITKPEECFCCGEVNRCCDKLEELEEELPCITLHPGFKGVCLNKWVLETAAIGLKTRKNRSYTVLRGRGQSTESQFLRSVAYRQFFRFIWDFTGNSRRLPLPCCVYNAIRSEFPSEEGTYRGFIEEDDNGEEDEEDENDEEQDEEEESTL